MRVNIGPYKSWIGPYQIADALCFWVPKITDEDGFKNKPDWVHDFGAWLGTKRDGKTDNWLTNLCQWIEKKRKRNIKVKIHDYDVWGMDHTLSLIIHPMLLRLKDCKQGSPFVDDTDVPEDIRSTSAAPKENDWDTDEHFHTRWAWVMDELLWTFEQIKDDTWEDQYHIDNGEMNFDEGKMVWKREPVIDWEGRKKHQARIDNGLRLFGRYFQGLWD
jgi:hypothetical protein